MSRGKHSQNVNARLRAQLIEAEDARRKLEHRVHEAELRRDAAEKRADQIERDGHPAVIAAEDRADRAASDAEKTVRGSEDEWAARIAIASPVLTKALREFLTSRPDFGVPSEIGYFVDGEAIFTDRREIRRKIATPARLRKTARQAKDAGAWPS